MIPPDPMAEIRAAFFVECEELLEALQDGLSGIGDGNGDEEMINICFRAVHSIKGGAGAFGLDELVRFAHLYEAALDDIRAGRLTPGHDAALLFRRAADMLSDIVRNAREGRATDAAVMEPVLAELETLCTTDTAQSPPSRPAPAPLPPAQDIAVFDIAFHPERDLFLSGNEPLFLLLALQELGPARISCDPGNLPDLAGLDPEAACIGWTIRLETPHGRDKIEEIFDFVEGLCRLTITRLPPEDTAPPPLPTVKTPPEKAPQPITFKPTIRVEVDRIERLANLVGELVINQAMLSQSAGAEGIASDTPLMQGLDDFLQLTRDIQDCVMTIRAQPVKPLFRRMDRIVREAAASLGKRVQFVTGGETTEVDRTIIEKLADPLTHMIRNAVDHGLETAPERLAAGKPEEGRITLIAAHRSGRVVIEISDDGAGIDRRKVRAIAEAKGLVAPDQPLSDHETDALLFLPGFSTRAKASHLSGRGVGMDVVFRSIRDLGGRIVISSRPGRGTRFSISLPLTLAILDGMVVEAAGETLVVPLGPIVETLMIRRENLRALGQGSRVLRIRDRFVPLIDLGAALGFGGPHGECHGSVALLIAPEDGQAFALRVDAIHEQRQVVIKGLQECYGPVPGIAAATILGDGRVALILAPEDLPSAPLELAG